MSEIEALIEARLSELEEQLRPLTEEQQRLERALEELRSMVRDGERRPNSGERATRRSGRRRAGARAAHGANVAAILEHVELHPGATAGAVNRATNISRGAVYSALSRLVVSGRLERRRQPDGTVAYYLTGGSA